MTKEEIKRMAREGLNLWRYAIAIRKKNGGSSEDALAWMRDHADVVGADVGASSAFVSVWCTNEIASVHRLERALGKR